MSKNIVDSVIEFCESADTEIGLIPSRRQVEYDGGYVNNWTTEDFVKYVRSKSNKVVTQRDHGGRKQGASPSAFRDKKSFIVDSVSGFDLIHIDPWKEFTSLDEIVQETANNILMCNEVNPSCFYEVGTEEAIHKYTSEELDYFLSALFNKLQNLSEKVVYAVIQAGTKIVGTRNMGTFDTERCRRMIDVCRKHRVLSKEHNGDYLTLEEIKTRFSLGLDAINIAPEFGVFETENVIKNVPADDLLKLYKICYDSGKWKKWVPPSFNPEENKRQLTRVCGHYIFSHPEFLKIKESADLVALDLEIKKALINKLNNMYSVV